MAMMFSRAVKTATLTGSSAVRSVGALVPEMRAFASAADANDGHDKKPSRPPRNNSSNNRGGGKNNLRFNAQRDGDQEPRSERKFSFAMKDKKQHDGRKFEDRPPTERKQRGSGDSKKFSFAPSAKAKEQAPELEVFEPPAYWDEDFPAEFDDSMKHEVEKLEVFADFTMLIDSSWQKEIHPLFDGAEIELTLNAPLEDFDERLFIDDKNTYDTKVVMQVPLTCFSGLTPEGLEVVKQLAGPRYNANKKKLKLTEDRYTSRVHNHKRLCDILRDLTQTASELAAAKTTEAEQ